MGESACTTRIQTLAAGSRSKQQRQDAVRIALAFAFESLQGRGSFSDRLACGKTACPAGPVHPVQGAGQGLSAFVAACFVKRKVCPEIPLQHKLSCLLHPEPQQVVAKAGFRIASKRARILCSASLDGFFARNLCA